MLPISLPSSETPLFIAPGANDLSARMRRAIALVIQGFGVVSFLSVRPLDDRLDPLLVLALEAILIGWILLRVARIVHTVRTVHAPARTRSVAAVRDVVRTAFPGPFGHVLLGEIAVWMSLWQVLTRGWRRDLATFSYHRGSNGIGMLVVVIVTAPVEILLFGLLIPWAPVRWLLLVASVYSVIWFAGLTLAPMAFPHLVGRNQLGLRNGALTQVDIPFHEIAGISRVRRPWPATTGRIPPSIIVRDGVAYLPGNDRNQLQLDLVHPLVVALEPAPTPVCRIVFTADDAEELIAAIEPHLATGITR